MLTWVKSQLPLSVWLKNIWLPTTFSKEMLASVKRSRMRYAEDLDEKGQEKLTNEQQIQKEILQRDINHVLEHKIKAVEKICKF